MERKLNNEAESGAFYAAKDSKIMPGVGVPTAETPELDGLLHIVTGGAVSITLNGEAVTIDSAGEHKIACPKGSTLFIGAGPVIGIYQFDGSITKSFKDCADLVFINNTTAILNGSEFFHQCYSLENLDGTVIKCTYPVPYGTFRSTRLYKAPYILNTSRVVNMHGFFEKNENLVSVPLIDTSNALTARNMFYGCSNLSSVPLYNFSKVTDIKALFYSCSSLKSLPQFDFSNVTVIENAFMLMQGLSEFPAGFNFNKVINGVLAFAGGWSYYYWQKDTYRIGGLLRFPEYSFPVCTSLMGAWMDQTVLFQMGKLNIPECTDMSIAFTGCFNLTLVGGFTGLKCDINMSHCTKLSRESLINIMTEAADVTSLGQRTMTFGTANLAKLTTEQKAIATKKGWTLL